MKFLDYVIIGAVLLLVVLAILLVKKRKKEGRGCSGNCASCDKRCK